MNEIRDIQWTEYGTTNLHPVALVFMICMTGLTLAPKRSGAIFAILAVCVFMPMEQRVVVAGLDFSMFRLLMLVAWLRVLVRAEYRGLSFGKLDRVVVLWMLSASLFHVLRVGPGGIVYRLGASFDVLTAYFLIRLLMRTREQVFVFWKHLAWIVLVLSPFFFYESTKLHNVFGVFDYAGFDIVRIRDGTPRCQGPFSHPILAGTFGAVLMPVFLAIALGRKNERLLFASACVGATIIVVTSGSSGPVMTAAVGALGWGMWRFRKYMRQVLWAAACMAVVIHFAREKPIWHLLARLSSTTTGGTGYHRYLLIDAFVRRFHEWALVGTDNTAYWGYGLQDITNYYIRQGVDGGLVTFVLFIVLLRVGFVQLRIARVKSERLEGPTSAGALLAWGSSVSLTQHCASFISVSYFGQMVPFFVIFVATIPAYARFRRPRRARSLAGYRPATAATPIAAAHFESTS